MDGIHDLGGREGFGAVEVDESDEQFHAPWEARVRGLVNAVGYPENPAALAAWAARLKKAHYNAIENLVIFAAVVLVLNAAQVSNETTVLACTAYFWARLAHMVVYALGIPWLRTLSFAASWVCIFALILQAL